MQAETASWLQEQRQLSQTTAQQADQLKTLRAQIQAAYQLQAELKAVRAGGDSYSLIRLFIYDLP